MPTWHIAASLERLRAQLNAMAPKRSKISDGAIGDTAHASRSSDHNPWYKDTVTARDFTHDPVGGLDCNWLADRLVESRDPRIKYVIWNRRICSGANGPQPWKWRTYSGSNAHTKHLHLSVMDNGSCESDAEWKLKAEAPAPKPPAVKPSSRPTLKRGSTGDAVGLLQRFLGLKDDEIFGPGTEAKVKAYQTMRGLTADGVVGPRTWAEMGLSA